MQVKIISIETQVYSTKYCLDKSKGLMAGLMVGDALGAPFEGKFRFKFPIDYRKFLLNMTPLIYTDDTQMAISILEECIFNKGIDQDSLKRRFIDRMNPNKGYGMSVMEVIDLWKNDISVQDAGKSLFDGTGSFANGGAMRIAPISIFFEGEQLIEQAKLATTLTHSNKLGVDGAILIAMATSLALKKAPIDK